MILAVVFKNDYSIFYVLKKLENEISDEGKGQTSIQRVQEDLVHCSSRGGGSGDGGVECSDMSFRTVIQ